MKATKYAAGIALAIAFVLALSLFFIPGCKDKSAGTVEGNTVLENKSTSEVQENTANASEDSQINMLVVKDNGTDKENETAENATTGADVDTLVAEEQTQAEEKTLENLRVSFIDVGYGDSIFIQTPKNGTMLIDGGSDDKGSVVMVYLRNGGLYDYLDVMMATHPDNENVGGLDSVLFNIAGVGEVYDNGQGAKGQSYQGFAEFSKVKGNFNVVTQDTTVNLDENMEVQLIVPYMDGYLNNSNDNSMVVKIKYGDVSFLLMGDCGFECEKRIMGHDLKADVLKVAHAGANDSTSQELLDAVKPKLAIISTGRNEFGYPDADVLERLAANNIEVLRTDLNGTIVIKCDGKEFTARASE